MPRNTPLARCAIGCAGIGVILVLGDWRQSLATVAAGTEANRIEALIAHVEGLANAKFVRNGIEYDAKTAGAFLRGKRDANQSKIKTAEDFIEHAATISSTTGKPYLIRFTGGKEVKSGEYLREQLKKLEMTPLIPGG
jgi:uncharacterized protein DUF5329